MTTIESTQSLSNLKYLSIFDYIKHMVFMLKRTQTIYTTIVYFQKAI